MIRNFLKRKAFTVINLFGLAAGMAICLLLVLYIQNELGYDQFQERADQIYRLALERKYPGRSNLWGELSKDFIMLVIISLFISMPLAYYFMSNWLLHYEYHPDMSWWVFAAAGLGAIIITILTVSYQGIKAAMMNPVISLRSQ